ncbi:hypothetical protein VE02_08129 [Pseudogymnoascus sp. 03VT05]|nr:hypothetical protein VE02_08129 [Pseudogymnoascus sp. 03VT05]
MAARTGSSSTSGFFQASPTVPPLYTASKLASLHGVNVSDEQVFDRALRLYLPESIPEKVETSIHNFTRLVIDPSTLRLTVDCETNQPELNHLNTFGEENKAIAAREGLIGHGHQQPDEQHAVSWNRRIHQFALVHAWIPTAALVSCPSAMTDGAATMIFQHLDKPDDDQPGLRAVLSEVYKRLISIDPDYAWTSRQWMTERKGGSNVRDTETVARRLTSEEIQRDQKLGRDLDADEMPMGPWQIDGFKWSSSATDSNMAMMLAQTNKGLSAFFAPMRRRTGSHAVGKYELNGVRIQRLKNKMGTKGLPTAELELKGTRGWMIGKEGNGIKEISAILNLTRIYTTNGALGFWGRALAISRAYTKTRNVRDGLLQDNPRHLRWMANQTVD